MNGLSVLEQKKVKQFRLEMRAAMAGQILHGGTTHDDFIDVKRRAWKWTTANERRRAIRTLALQTIRGMHLTLNPEELNR